MSDKNAYWKANLRLIAFCLVIWFLVSFVFGILLVEQLNTFKLGGYKLFFKVAEPTAIYTFLVLIFFYASRMNKLDRKFGLDEKKG